MIKLVYVIDRHPSLTPAAFYDYWLNKHGPLVRRHAATLRTKKAIQSHTIDTPANDALQTPRGMLPPIAGITETWWDSLADFEAAMSSPEGQAAAAELAADEARFINFAGSSVFLTQEHEILDYTATDPKQALGEASIKCTYLLARREGMSREECHRTWLEDHGPVVERWARLLGMAKYVQSHTVGAGLMEKMVEGRGLAAPFDGITEVWIADPAVGGEGSEEEVKAGGEALVKDERRFVEMERSRCFMTKEHVVFDYMQK